MNKLYVGSGIIAAIVIAGCGVDSKTNSNDTNRLNSNVNGNSSTGPSPTAKKLTITAGDWEVGKKENLAGNVIVAGTYVITATDNGIGCYWATVKDFDSKFDSIIANGNIDPGKTARVNVKSSYAGLHLEHDCLAAKKK